jgi:hypothetical protein
MNLLANQSEGDGSGKARARVAWGILLFGALVLWFSYFYASASSMSSPRERASLAVSSTLPPAAPMIARAQKSVHASVAASPTAKGHIAVEQGSLEPQRAERASAMFRHLEGQIAEATRFFGPVGTEAAANHVLPYLEGWMDAALQLDPNLADDMSAHIDSLLCDKTSSEIEKLTLLRMSAQEPLFATERGLRCVISEHTTGGLKEGLVLRAGLEAWSAARLPVSDEIVRLGKVSKDDRTLMRIEELMNGGRTERDLDPQVPPHSVEASSFGPGSNRTVVAPDSPAP